MVDEAYNPRSDEQFYLEAERNMLLEQYAEDRKRDSSAIMIVQAIDLFNLDTVEKLEAASKIAGMYLNLVTDGVVHVRSEREYAFFAQLSIEIDYRLREMKAIPQ